MADDAQATAGPDLPEFLKNHTRMGTADDGKSPLFGFSFLGLGFASGVNEALRDKLIEAQKELYKRCCQELGKPQPTEDEFTIWCWTGTEPIGNPKDGDVNARLAKLRRDHKHIGHRPRAGFHANGSAVDVNVPFNPYVATRNGEGDRAVHGGEEHDISDALLQKVAKLTDEELKTLQEVREFNKQEKDATKKKKTDPGLSNRIAAAKAQFHTEKLWKPAVDGYDRAHSLFFGKGADLHEETKNSDRFTHGPQHYERFSQASNALREYFGFALVPGPGNDGNCRKKDFEKNFSPDFSASFDANKFHVDAVDPDGEKLFKSMASPAKAAELEKADDLVKKARKARSDFEQRSATRKRQTDQKKTAALKKAEDQAKAAERDKQAALKIQDSDKRIEALNMAEQKAQDAENAKRDALAQAEQEEQENSVKDKQEEPEVKKQEKEAQDAQQDALKNADGRAQQTVKQKADELNQAKQKTEEAKKAEADAQTELKKLSSEADQARKGEQTKKNSGASEAEIEEARTKREAAEKAETDAQTRLKEAEQAHEKAKSEEKTRQGELDKAMAQATLDPEKRKATLKKYFDRILVDHEEVRFVMVQGKVEFSDDGKDKKFKLTRDPCRGFLNIRRDVVEILVRDQQIVWGACMFGMGLQGSGDMMHFDIGKHFA